MNLKLVDLKKEYRSLNDNVLKDFYYPVLKESIEYDRAVGFFSSTSLAAIADGLIPFIHNGGTIRLIASPKLSEEDINAINKGYKLRDELIKDVVLSEIKEIYDEETSKRLNLLANLIEDNKLDIKIAITSKSGLVGMYHEKMGIFKDVNNNYVAFTGSMNESMTALSINYESIDVYCSWGSNDEKMRAKGKIDAFNRIWNNEDPSVYTIFYPEIKQEILRKYKKTDCDYDKICESEFIYSITTKIGENIKEENIPRKPDDFNFYNYQVKAIDKWEQCSYKGIFDMATGTGKTYTGLGAITRLSQKLNNNLGVIIVCPYQHLVEQWVEDIIRFNIKPIIAYSSSSQKDWKKRLDNSIRDQKLGVKNKKFFCVVTTNATFSGKYVQDQINKMKGNLLLLVDEAHNFGSFSLKNKLNEKFQYRLALSATLERNNDEEGTNALYSYFGEKCIEYSLERAIEEGFLTRYKYYPRIIYLSDYERELYEKFSNEIKRCIIKNKKGKVQLTEQGKIIALKRAKIVSGAINKIPQLKKDIQRYINKNHILVYCGSTNVLSFCQEDIDANVDNLRQIDLVTTILGNELNMKVSQFTSREDIVERERLKQEFDNGESLQALIAIKCLDEGVNIPSIRTAFILASTSNPKEYIQRRGRVLRISKGKEFAEIYDYITLPRKLEDVRNLTNEQMQKEIQLVKSELKRASEFARIADNGVVANSILDEIRDVYNLIDNKIYYEEGENYFE